MTETWGGAARGDLDRSMALDGRGCGLFPRQEPGKGGLESACWMCVYEIHVEEVMSR